MSWRALTRYTCDLCEATVEVPTSRRQPEGWGSFTIMMADDDDESGSRDLCPECVAVLQAWLAGVKADRMRQRSDHDRQ